MKLKRIQKNSINETKLNFISFNILLKKDAFKFIIY